MSSLIIWCMLTVTLSNEVVETAVNGVIVSETDTYYAVDFSEYATKQEYDGNWAKIKFVKKELCVENR